MNIRISIILLLLVFSCTPQKNIMESTDINEIEMYLTTSHPQDPKTKLLRQRLTTLKNKAWTEVEDWKPMSARITKKSDSLSSLTNPLSNQILLKTTEVDEFNSLNTKTPDEYKEQTVRLLNNIFDKDNNKNEAVLLIKNNSDCNIIIRITGEKQYNIPIKAKGENSILVDKGNYLFASKICDANYNSQKSITKDLQIVLNNSLIKETIEVSKKPIKTSKPVKKKKGKLS